MTKWLVDSVGVAGPWLGGRPGQAPPLDNIELEHGAYSIVCMRALVHEAEVKRVGSLGCSSPIPSQRCVQLGLI